MSTEHKVTCFIFTAKAVGGSGMELSLIDSNIEEQLRKAHTEGYDQGYKDGREGAEDELYNQGYTDGREDVAND